MKRLQPWTQAEIVEHNLRDGGMAYTAFAEAQTDRVWRCRGYIRDILDAEYGGVTPVIVEPGCSTGDISGFFTSEAEVVGIDVTPGAAQAARLRWPAMEIIEDAIEAVRPQPCDILVLCEFLEHVDDPIGLVKAWLPLAKYVVIGHPLVGDGPDIEPGHVWGYTQEDFEAWFPMGGHVLRESQHFQMGWYSMVLGWGALT